MNKRANGTGRSFAWREFVETMSRVEQILRCDPRQIYAKMQPDASVALLDDKKEHQIEVRF